VKKDRLWIHLALVGLGALLVYAAVFAWVEHRRTRLGPWEVIFIHEPPEAPQLLINHEQLGIRDVAVILPTLTNCPATNAILQFGPGREVPFEVPFGRCTHQDPLFLPGVVALELGGQQIQIFPRALKINDAEHPWKAGLTIEATAEVTPSGRESDTRP
jgi:hypothetical protein